MAAFFIQAHRQEMVDSLFDADCTTMEKHCNSIVIPMSEKGESKGFTITLPTEAIEDIEKGLIPFGLYGKKRATICRTLILDLLKTPAVQANVEKGRAKAFIRPGVANSPSTDETLDGSRQR